MDQIDLNLEEFIIKNHNPNNQYCLIKQDIKNLEMDLYEFDDCIDEDYFRRYQKINIFRGTVQYIEEFLLYFLAKFNGEKYSEVLARTDNKKIFDKIDNILELEDLSKNLIERFELNEFNVNEFIEGLNNVVLFFKVYKDAYNSIKHGFRVFPLDFDYFELGNDEVAYERLDISEEYVEFICKNGDTIYVLCYPIDCLIEDCKVVLEYIDELFNFSMRKNKYKDNIDFQCNISKEFNNYVHLRNGGATLFFRYDEWFEKYLSGNKFYFYAQFVKNNKKIKICLSEVPKYPFLVSVETNQIMSTSPKLFEIKKIKLIEFSSEGDIEQIEILNEIKKSSEDFKFQVIFKSEKCDEFELDLGDYIDYDFEEPIISILIRIKQILGIDVSFPFNLTEMQYNLLINHDGKFEKQKDAELFVNELKKDNTTKVNVFLDVIGMEENIVSHKFLGYTFNLNILNFFQIEQLEDEEQIYSYDFKHIPANAFFAISEIKRGLFNGNDLSDLKKYNFQDSLKIKIEYSKKLWVNEYNILIIAHITNN